MTTAEAARVAAGLTAAQVAKRARIGTPYLRRIERHGRAPEHLAVRLSFITGASPKDYLFARHVGATEQNVTPRQAEAHSVTGRQAPGRRP